MYIAQNPTTKKAAKALVAAGEAQLVCVGPFDRIPENGRVAIEGPHYPRPHAWYATGIVEDGRLVKLS